MVKIFRIAGLTLVLIVALLGIFWLAGDENPVTAPANDTTPVPETQLPLREYLVPEASSAPDEAMATASPTAATDPSAEPTAAPADDQPPVATESQPTAVTQAETGGATATTSETPDATSIVPPAPSPADAQEGADVAKIAQPGTVNQISSDVILDTGDPLYNDAPWLPPVTATEVISAGVVNYRYAHLTFEFVFTNTGPGDVTNLDIYVAVPPDRDNQTISNLTFSGPYAPAVDQYGQQIALFKVPQVAAGETTSVSWEADVKIEAQDFHLDPAKTTGLDTIPPEIIATYTSDEDKYRLDSPIIQNAAAVAANGATNPYWIARNIHDYIAEHMSYYNDGKWSDAETVYVQRIASCSEYAFLFVSLCRANGLPARYVAGTRDRKPGVYVDDLFHRWTEVYLPPYGWVPIDTLHDDRRDGIQHYFFGAVKDDRLATTVGGGDSEYLGWNYHNAYRYDYEGERPIVERKRYFVWEPYPAAIQVEPGNLEAQAPANRPTVAIGDLAITSGNGDYDWSLVSASDWLRLAKSKGKTPDVLGVEADTTGLAPGNYSGSIVLLADNLGQKVTIPVQLSVIEDNP